MKRQVREMMTILLEDNPNVGLAWFVFLMAHSAQVKNYRMAPSIHINNRQQDVWLAD